jgi:multiple sugar transport system ATP-binding protein
MSQLEPHLRAKLRARIKDYLIQNKMTSVFVTHDQTEAMALADRIAVMSEGVLQQFGSPVNLKERPANLFVAGFIGEPPMNLLKGQVVAEGRARQLTVLNEKGGRAFSLPVPDHALAAPLQNGKRVHLGIRPHKIVVSPAGNGTGRAHFSRFVASAGSGEWRGPRRWVGCSA